MADHSERGSMDDQTARRVDEDRMADDERRAEIETTMSKEPFNIRLAWQCEPGVTREQAEIVARQIERWVEGFAAVSHCFEREVYDVLDDDEERPHGR